MMLGIDLGGTKISGVLLDKSGNTISKLRVATPRGKNFILDAITNLVHALDPSKKSKSIGIGIPGIAQSGIIRFMPNLSELIGTNIHKELSRKTGRKVFIENDAKCFALAEHKMGAGKGKQNVIGIILGTGVGCGIIVNGEIFRGTSGGAGELGQTKMEIKGRLVRVEDLISGPALIREYEMLSGKMIHSLNGLSDKHYKEVHRRLVERTGLMCANLINIFNPECIVFGGGVSNLDFCKETEELARLHAIPFLAKDCRIIKHKLGDDAGAIGAAFLGQTFK